MHVQQKKRKQEKKVIFGGSAIVQTFEQAKLPAVGLAEED
jgi:hypothetical protein